MAKRGAADPTRELITILDWIRYASSRFVEAKLAFGQGPSDAVGEATLLVGEALHLSPDDVDAFLTARTTQAERRKILTLVRARIRTRKPAAYLVHRAYMRGVPFYVDERVIVPRSYLGELLDSELFAGGDPALIADPGMVGRVLDLCTGSGCLAIMACRAFPNAKVDAVDISPEALKVAEINVAEHELGERITLLQGDLFAPVGSSRYDLILANPPYVDRPAMAKLPREYRHEPQRALAAGADGLDIIRRILAEAGRHMVADGGLLCEVGRGRDRVEATHPDRRFLWLDTQTSSGEVFWLPAADVR